MSVGRLAWIGRLASNQRPALTPALDDAAVFTFALCSEAEAAVRARRLRTSSVGISAAPTQRSDHREPAHQHERWHGQAYGG